VARYANVSPSTVSRVIKGNKKISLATIQKVQTAMDELNYFPNQAARTLITKKQTQSVLSSKVKQIYCAKIHSIMM